MRNDLGAEFLGAHLILLAQQCPIYNCHTMSQKYEMGPIIIILHKSERFTRCAHSVRSRKPICGPSRAKKKCAQCMVAPD
jgi:hypothetical protein